ncbi:trigger factor [Actinocatenispora rupis]|uniref:Trigger factor n=1 Tax=Actinocatenispora rupis TaxID=519421 RepID=A0A8J3JGG1_9ACTN|nr:trigger factor [Actinocatenispora rupis]GID15927.1 trigger factor [Actinocatenispora rupis]
MKSAVETLSPTRVKVSVEVPFSELEPSVKKAYRTIAQQVSIPGFRPGKVPTRLIDQKVGRGTVLQEAVQEALPEQYMAAIREHDVKAIGRPEVEVTELNDGDHVSFTAEVDVRPEITLPELDSISATVDELSIGEDDVDEQVGQLRDRFATLKGVDRPAADGDYVSLDLLATIDDEEVEGGTANGLSYEIGSGQLLDGIDEALVGMTADETRTFASKLVGGPHAGEEAQIAVTVKSVREKELPELDDEFAQLASEFDTLDELRADVRGRVERNKKLEQAYQARDKALESLLAATEVPVPEGVVTEEVEFRKENMGEQLAQMGSNLEQYLAAEGKSAEEFDAELRTNAEEAVKTQLVLDALADAEEVGVNDQELTEEVVRRAQMAGAQPQQYADQLVRSGQLSAVVADVRRGKALSLVLDHASVTDTAGRPVDIKAVLNPAGEPQAEGAAEAVEAADDAESAPANSEG